LSSAFRGADVAFVSHERLRDASPVGFPALRSDLVVKWCPRHHDIEQDDLRVFPPPAERMFAVVFAVPCLPMHADAVIAST
jgi:hypothetical protein